MSRKTPYLLLLTLLLWISACVRPAAEIALEEVHAQSVEQSIAATVASIPTVTATNPPVIIIQPTESFDDFSLPSATELTAQAPTATATPLPATAVPTENPVETNTPAPTFTPPSLPFTSTEEHFWFRRPVPEGSAVWTDKEYPYGSTKGGTLRTHHGVEFNVGYNTQILATAAGTVVVAGNDAEQAYGPQTNFYGNLIVIQHDSVWQNQPVFTLYGHLNDIYVSVGQRVDMQQVIGLSGATGIADGPHLHFEVRYGTNSYDTTKNPLLWLYPFPQKSAVAGRISWPDGSPAANAPVRLVRVDAQNRYQATTTYADQTVNPDSQWNENFVIDDVDPGFYEVIIDAGSTKYTAEVWVFAYQTSFVEIVLD
ncbi:MAG: M23 family metallopeptidase [Chloroflexota bacterium]